MRMSRHWPAYAALAVILAVGLALRLVHLRHGLPFVFHSDEALHFTSRAIAMFGGDLNPHYFENPAAFTYLVYGALRITHGGGFPFDDVGGLVARFAADPTPAYATGRVIAAVLSMVGVAATFSAGRRLWGPGAGVAAAGVLAFAFLTVAYSRYAVTDTGALAPVAVAAYGAVRAYEDGRLRHYALVGAAVGLAVGFKYTAGLVGVPLLVAALLRVRRDRRAIAGLALAGVAATATFFLTNPFFFVDLREAVDQLGEQSAAASTPKLGQGEAPNPLLFYARSLTWGLGWAGALAAAAGLAWQAREDRVRALLLGLFPILLVLYLSTAGRYFGRWLMPAYPVLALLAGLAIARAAALVARRPALRGAVLVALLLGVIAQPLLAGVRTGRAFGRADTREVAREHLLRSLPENARVVVEPAVPKRFFGGKLTVGFKAPVRELVRGGTPQRFILSLEPGRIDAYRKAGYCTVVTLSTVRGRAIRDRVGPALAYYERLEDESRVVFRASPYRPGAEKPRFDFDWTTHLFYPSAYERPGPEILVRRLDDCRQQSGGRPAVLAPPPGLPGPDPESLD